MEWKINRSEPRVHSALSGERRGLDSISSGSCRNRAISRGGAGRWEIAPGHFGLISESTLQWMITFWGFFVLNVILA